MADQNIVAVKQQLVEHQVFQHAPGIGASIAVQVVTHADIRNIVFAARLQQLPPLHVVSKHVTEQVRLRKRRDVEIRCRSGRRLPVGLQRTCDFVNRCFVADIVRHKRADTLEGRLVANRPQPLALSAHHDIANDYGLVYAAHIVAVHRFIRLLKSQIRKAPERAILIEQVGKRSERTVLERGDIRSRLSRRLPRRPTKIEVFGKRQRLHRYLDISSRNERCKLARQQKRVRASYVNIAIGIDSQSIDSFFPVLDVLQLIKKEIYVRLFGNAACDQIVQIAIVDDSRKLHRFHLERKKPAFGNALLRKVTTHHVKQRRLPAAPNTRDYLNQVGILECDELIEVLLPHDHKALRCSLGLLVTIVKTCTICKF